MRSDFMSAVVDASSACFTYDIPPFKPSRYPSKSSGISPSGVCT